MNNYFDQEGESSYGKQVVRRPYKEVPFQLSNELLLRSDQRIKDPKKRLFPIDATLSKGRIISPSQFIVALKHNPNDKNSETIWKAGNKLWLGNKKARIQVDIIKSRKCSPTGKRYLLIQTTGGEAINELEERITGIFDTDKGGNQLGTIHGGGVNPSAGTSHGGGVNPSAGTSHGGGQSNCFGLAQLVKPLADFLSEIEARDTILAHDQDGKKDRLIVAVLDSGILSEIDQSIRSTTCLDLDQFGWNFVDDNSNTNDNHLGLHGTKVSMLIRKYAPDTRILPVKISNQNGVIDLYDALCGLEYALNRNAKLVNASWSFTSTGNNDEETDYPLLLGAVRDLDEQGVMVIAAAGNRSQYDKNAKGEIAKGNAPKIYPACYSAIQSNVITVTTVIEDNNVFRVAENYSSRFVDTGTQPKTLPPLPSDSFVVPGFKLSYEGSSFATPIVTARVAVVLNGLTGYTGKHRILKQLSGFHEEDDLVNQIRNGGCYVSE